MTGAASMWTGSVNSSTNHGMPFYNHLSRAKLYCNGTVHFVIQHFVTVIQLDFSLYPKKRHVLIQYVLIQEIDMSKTMIAISSCMIALQLQTFAKKN